MAFAESQVCNQQRLRLERARLRQGFGAASESA
jgi:hypothetical protein